SSAPKTDPRDASPPRPKPPVPTGGFGVSAPLLPDPTNGSDRDDLDLDDVSRTLPLTRQSTNGGTRVDERVAIVGSGAIACGLAATASANGQVVLWARSKSSADRARASVDKTC